MMLWNYLCDQMRKHPNRIIGEGEASLTYEDVKFMNDNRINITIKLNGEEIVFPKQQPGLINGTSVAPIRVIFEKLGYTVDWEPRPIHILGIFYYPIGKLTLTKDDKILEIWEAANSYKLNGEIHEFPAGHTSKQIGNTIMVPIRDILESVGYYVVWDGATRTVDISTEPIKYFRIRNGDEYITYSEPIVGDGETLKLLPVSANDSNSQIWKIEEIENSDKYRIKPACSNVRALNVYRSGDYPCTVQLTFNNSEDTSFSINKNSVGTYNITWNSGSSTRYLGRINSETYWLTTTDNTYTQWIFEPVYYNQNNLKKELYMPVNINQRYFDSLSGKCAGVCAMDISNYYRGKDYPQFNEDDNTSLDDEVKKEVKAMLEIGMFTGNALNWGAVPGVAFMNTYKDGSVSAEEIYALAVDSINNGYPIMIHYYDEPVYNPNGNTHWVIPVAYDENNPGLENITVCDPTTRNVTYAVNKTWSLSDSFDYNMKKENDSTPYYYGFVLTYPKKENTN